MPEKPSSSLPPSKQQGNSYDRSRIEKQFQSRISPDELQATYDWFINKGCGQRYSNAAVQVIRVLDALMSDPFLQERLVIHGGTVIGLGGLLGKITRLSGDIDADYRHIDDMDWGDVRDEIDRHIKQALYEIGISNDEITIDPSYPLGRFTIRPHKKRQNYEDASIKIEIGYMRRQPLLAAGDRIFSLRLPTISTPIVMRVPQIEEVCAAKVSALLVRQNGRDFIDVYRIANLASADKLNESILLTLVLVHTLGNLPYPVFQMDIDSLKVSLNDQSIRDRLATATFTSMIQNPQIVLESVREFIRHLFELVTEQQRDAVFRFYRPTDHKFSSKAEALEFAKREVRSIIDAIDSPNCLSTFARSDPAAIFQWCKLHY